MPSLPRVAIIIVCYNGVADTLECLDSLSRVTYPDAKIVVVDNASTDGTAQVVRERFPAVHVLETGDNRGYAGGNNAGVRYALDTLRADYTFLLNNDTTVQPGLLEPLVAHAETNRDAGISGPMMCYYDAPDTVWASGGEMSTRADSVLRGNGIPVADINDQLLEQDFVVGCGMLVRRDVWETVGCLDERFFLYYEDSDLCFRAMRAGFRNVTVPSVRLYHKVSRSTGAGSELTVYYMRRNALLFLQKNGSFWGRVAAIADNVRLFCVWKLKGDTRCADILAGAVADYFAGRFGRKTPPSR
ncbi:MAG: glycosyltransferase family 2 protein [Fibrella sp.]|nr:glycosyltransferase family 2 protein [Armatimonadota bacterium]